jgi:FkbM family methyltransferase
MGAMNRALKSVKSQLFNTFNREEYATVRGVRLLSRHPAISPKMRFVLFNRRYEEPEAALMEQAVRPTDRVLEIGAAIGFLGCFAQTRLGVKDYALVEANAALIEVITTNQRANGVGGQVIHAAAAGTDGPIRFAAAADFWASSLSDEGEVVVDGLTLPSLKARLPFTPNVLVMDIEGGEVSLPPEHFDGFEVVVMETHPSMVGDEATDALLAALDARGLKEVARKDAVVLLSRRGGA